MKLYIAGPMTGIPQFNFPAFFAARHALEESGYEAISPAELDDMRTRAMCLASEAGDPGDIPHQTWGEALARDVQIIADEVDGVALLPGWEDSRGARLETLAARLSGKPIFYPVPLEVQPDVHDRVCHCAELGNEWELFGTSLIELDDAELDRVLARGSDPRVLMKIAEDTGEVRVTSDTGGQKGRKPERMDLIPPEFLWELARVYGFGASKYDDHNYLKGYDYSLSYGAMMRHATQWANGEDQDSESGCHHLAHVAWHCAALLMFQAHGLGTDDRLPNAAGLSDSERITRTGRSEEARS